jgi:N-acetylmuramoyl-L-alanine amidase
MAEVYAVSACVAEELRDLGYRVVLTKRSASDTVGLADRAAIADRVDADLAISVHDDHSQTPAFQAVYSQRGIRHGRGFGPMWRGSGDRRTVFDRPRVARASDRYARIIARERARAQHRPIAVTEEDFTGRAGLEPGNLALVQLLSSVPWVYNEAGALTGGSTSRRMPPAEQAGYAKGLLDGVVAAVPPPGPSRRPASAATIRSCLGER